MTNNSVTSEKFSPKLITNDDQIKQYEAVINQKKSYVVLLNNKLIDRESYGGVKGISSVNIARESLRSIMKKSSIREEYLIDYMEVVFQQRKSVNRNEYIEKTVHSTAKCEKEVDAPFQTIEPEIKESSCQKEKIVSVNCHKHEQEKKREEGYNDSDIQKCFIDQMITQTWISRNYFLIKWLWMIIFILLICLGIFLIFHHINLITSNGVILSLYHLLGIIIAFLSFIIGYMGICLIRGGDTKKHQKISWLLILGLAITILNYIIGSCVVEKEMSSYLRIDSYFNQIYFALVTLQVLCLFLNHKMSAFYQEYYSLLPLKDNLLSQDRELTNLN